MPLARSNMRPENRFPKPCLREWIAPLGESKQRTRESRTFPDAADDGKGQLLDAHEAFSPSQPERGRQVERLDGPTSVEQ